MLAANANGRSLSAAAAGGVGAGVALGVVLILVASLASLGLVSFRRRQRRPAMARSVRLADKTDDWVSIDQVRLSPRDQTDGPGFAALVDRLTETAASVHRERAQ